MATENAMGPPREIGSFLARMASPTGDVAARDDFSYLGNVEWLATGRMVLQALCCRSAHGSRRIHVPAYFCPDVVQSLRRTCSVVVYMDSPLLPHPEWETLRASADDLVLAVDYFGLRSFDVWRDWQRSHPAVLLVQDHTHSPRPDLESIRDADYAFASVRKSLPIFDGAWVVSPKGHPLPAKDAPLSEPLHQRFVHASQLKRAYLQGENPDKDAFLTMFRESEHELEEQPLAGISAGSAEDLLQLDVPELLSRRHRNARRMIKELRTGPLETFSVLPPGGPRPWNPVLRFPNRKVRDDVRRGLIEQSVFAPVHWPIEENDLPPAYRGVVETAGCLLTLPVDYRCSDTDLSRIRRVLEELSSHA
jgi:hypothetical protein